jgi:protein MpaA
MIRLALAALFAMLAAQAPIARAGADTADALCESLGKRLHSVSTDACRAQHFVAAPERTALGNVLMFRDIEAGNPSDNAKRVLVIGGIHGDELTSVSTVFRWLDWMRQPEAGAYNWRVIPLANPDGLMARPSTRVNANGVDLNRNFQTPDWDKDAGDYWARRTRHDPRRYPGKAAGSEIETRWLEAQIAEFKPDLIVSVHAPYNLLDYDGQVPEPTRFGRLLLNRLGVYPGSMGNYSGLYKQIPIITIELPNASSMPSPRDQEAMWSDMLKWMRHNIVGKANEPAPSASGSRAMPDTATNDPRPL